MQTGIPLRDLNERVRAQQAQKLDLIADTRRINVSVDVRPEGEKRLPAVRASIQGEGVFPIRHLAKRQMGTWAKIPALYVDRMIDEAPELFVKNMEHWFQQTPKLRMARMLGGEMRAFLSNSYQRIDHIDVLQATLPILSEIPGVIIRSCELTETRMYIHAVAPNTYAAVKVNDVIQAGVIISNSEVGEGAVEVSPWALQLKCLNGMKVGTPLRKMHVGRQAADTEALWADDTRAADDKALLLKARDMVRSAVDEATFVDNVRKMQGLTEQRITGDVAKSVRVLAQKIGASEAEHSDILAAFIEGGDMTAWGLQNAVTNIAHKAKDYDRAVEIETLGGALIDLPPSEWKPILAAA